ncbi:LuxR C-terminal-related transcriptional regulator [Nonomuraea sp. NPDC059023]|uniref:helix-turn-helix transcriptional regulator n=1 Tax=unclassified Nonomuraea TaxID=2593643 RepID=UPI00369EF885
MTRKLRGREAEERQIALLLRRVAAGASSALYVEGGWGSGRTRLLREAASLAAHQGFTVLDGSWPSATDISAHASHRPVLVILDDLHHADAALIRSLDTASWRLRDRPIAWIFSRRRGAGDPAAERLFTRARVAGSHVDLRPLSAHAIGQIVSDHAGAAAAGLPHLARMTGGNALLSVEMARGVDSGRPGDFIDEPPDRARACVRSGMVDLSEVCRQLLCVGALLGPRFTLGDVAKMLRRTVAELIAPVEEVLAADILACEGEWLVFTQEVFRRCLLASLPRPALTALEAEAGRAGVEERFHAARLPDPVRKAAGWAALSDAERTVARLAGQGLTNQQIASRVSRSPHTVNYHLRRIFRKLGIRSRIELVMLAPADHSAADVMDTAG